MNNKIIGNIGENIVKKYLERLNYKILKTNFTCRQGEIDIIAKYEQEIIFVEVKTRINKHFGYAIEAVDINKQKHIKNVTKYFIYKYNLQKYYIRFDVIEVYLKKESYYLNHIKNVLW